ncbi:MAG: hypothetical protein AB7I04_07265 [Pseudomonadales bacterium]
MMDPVQLACLQNEYGLVVEQKDGWLRLYLRGGRQRGLAAASLLVGVTLILASLSVPAHYLPEPQLATTAIRATCAGFGVCLTLLALYLPFNALEVRIGRRKIIRLRTWLGLGFVRREVNLDDLEELEIDRAAATTGSPIAICYGLVGRGRFGRFKLIESIPDRSLVEAVRAQVMIAAGLRPSPTH